MRAILFLAAAMLSFGQPAVAADPLYIVRHLQKGEGSDPSLSDVGRAQADVLASLLAAKGIKAIFATPTRRAMETAAPLAKRLHISVTAYDPSAPGKLVEAARAVHAPVLIVGHSNTVPDLVTRFGGSPAPVLSDEDYGTVFIVDSAAGTVRQLQLPKTR